MAAMTLAEKIAGLIREARKSEGLTQSAVGDASRLGQAQIAKMESGESLQNIDTLVKVLAGAGYELRLTAVKKATSIELTL
jgi:transcriptional regulator with XRE-family HTH domain